ncbi:unnamed protein product [Clavelina lepadiformis]|uniref:Anion exchange protein n=1 Tax=Clavelina lepadiformis TaxID=159417 RepID=A0ABP0F1S8_CLALP
MDEEDIGLSMDHKIVTVADVSPTCEKDRHENYRSIDNVFDKTEDALESKPTSILKSPRSPIRRYPVFYVSKDYDCVITSAPENVPEIETDAERFQRQTLFAGYVNRSYNPDQDESTTLRNRKRKKNSAQSKKPKEKNRSKRLSISSAGKNLISLGQGWRTRTSSVGSPWRMDNETQPILDHGQSSMAQIEDALDQHRNVYVGMPLGSNKHKHHKHHKRKSEHRKSSRKYSRPEEVEDEDDAIILPPNQQVQFILGTEHDGLECLEKHSPGTPRLFTEMEQLKEEDGEVFWRETARWLKFEECVEEGGDRWSKPHVATLSLHSLFELRSCIMNGVVQLDMAAQELTQIADLVLDQMVQQGQLPHDDDLRDKLRAALLSNHEHQGERRKGIPAIKSVADFVGGRKDTSSDLRSQGLNSTSSTRGSIARTKSSTGASNGGMENHNSFSDNDKKNKIPYFMKKIPTGAEASNVLIGEVDFLEQRIIAFVRLEESVNLGRLTEVPIPTRFLFILLGPTGNYKQYHEIGRSIATLMADEVFHEVAYKAKTRKDLLAGIDEFLDQVTVLPPGEWDASTRIQPPKDLPGNQKKRLSTKKHGSPAFSEKELPEEHGVSPELQRTGRLFGGLLNDIKRKAPFYASDFKDCLSIQCVASFIFLYFAILTPIVTFGGLLGDATHNYLGTMESILGGAIAGTTYHMFCGQPLTIIGSTGPILVFESIMFDLCESLELHYISFRFWVGVWTGIICLLLVAFDASSLISYVTRYTEESFSALISIIFIYEAFKKLAHEGDKLKIWYGWEPDNITFYSCQCLPPDLSSHNISNVNITDMKHISREEAASSHEGGHHGKLFKTGNESYVCAYANNVTEVESIDYIPWTNLSKHQCVSEFCGNLDGASCLFTPDAVFMSVILFFGTFAISMALKSLKTSRYFPNKVRSIISDFAVTIGIITMVLFDLFMDIRTPKLSVPTSFRPTRDDRKWFIDPFEGGNAWWSAILAILPALLATILIFMDQQITAVIVNRRENKLKKGCGYHLDLFIVSVMLIICSVFGLPWFVAATVLSITHVNSLRMETETSAPGEIPKFLGVREQRVTGVMIFLMIGLSVFITPILAKIPMPVLYGVFLYMGVSSLRGVQFIDRLKLFFMPAKHQPDFIYLRHVPLPKVHLFTIFQVLGLAVLWAIKSNPPVSIIFPIMVAALVGIRKLFDFVFTQHDLMWLDDLMPESTKKRKEDARKKKEAEAASAITAEEVSIRGTGTVNVPLEDGKVLQIPVSELKYNPDDPSNINISNEMSRTAIWKTLASNEIRNNSYSDLRRRPGSKRSTDVVESHVNGNGSSAHKQNGDPVPSYEVAVKIQDDETGV